MDKNLQKYNILRHYMAYRYSFAHLACFFTIIALTIFITSPTKEVAMAATQNTLVEYTMPAEENLHEGTWLQWPHHHQFGMKYRNRLDPIWVAMTKVLVHDEAVHIIVYDEKEKHRVANLLHAAGISEKNVSFHVYPTDDVWVRDNGPIYVRDADGKLAIVRWGFNGWGEKAEYSHCEQIPAKIAREQKYPLIDLSHDMVNEGGSVELDGNGTLLACKSSILNANRNPGMSAEEAEHLFTRYLGATHFIWLDGTPGLDITDMHIDGFARFPNSSTLLTMNREDLEESGFTDKDITTLHAAKNKDGIPYTLVLLPLTKHDVTTEDGKNLGYKGSYLNYYVSNGHVLMPAYDDPHDATAQAILQKLYPTRTVVPIDVRNLYEHGGMIHCVTQQQPMP